MPVPPIRLGVNIDHVATVRNARGGRHPDPLKAAEVAIAAGADGITAHLREDRRHIRDADIAALERELSEKLSAKVAVQHGRGGRGKLVIAYHGLDALDGILERLRR